MVKPIKKIKSIDYDKAKVFAEKADDIKEVKRGNPRQKKKKPASFSIPLEMDVQIDLMIERLNRQGYFGISRSDIVVAALSSEFFIENFVVEVTKIKGFN
ncbi:hypothetical protein ETN89_20590 (plasmid) [Photobacterium damselae subsp. damselae]|uniref:hypothetical protein n=1 Tax=Photobacterium damselae TaxID=38293 RepID=UPI000A2FBD3E|nr:hypothetical protein [Photobacterium damselae]ARR51882.1 hypothetical protein CAY62_21010 [Photobacterium damselae subsp. damselae]QAY37632.1 hypothetical protein ETN89_20590 [Photobacterium damselae subsp. damselae]